MTKSSKNINKSIPFLIGVPLLLLLGSLMLAEPREETILASQANKYLPSLPSQYLALADNTLRSKNSNDPVSKGNSFFTRLEEDEFERRLVIMKKLPSKEEVSNDFLIDIFPKTSQSNKQPLKITHTNNAVIYRYRNTEFALFKIKLPFVNIDSIEVVQKKRFPKPAPWEITLKSDLPDVDFQPPYFISDGTRRQAHQLRPLLNRVLEDYNINHDFLGFEMSGDTIYELYREDLSNSNSEPLTWTKVSDYQKFWSTLANKNTSVKFIGEFRDEAEGVMDKYRSGEKNFQSTFDQEKWINYYSIVNLFTANCFTEPMVLVFNNETKLIEPYFSFYKCLGQNFRFIRKPSIDNLQFLDAYAQRLKDFSELDFLLYLKDDPVVMNSIKWINYHHPDKIFDLDYVRINQLKIKKHLNQSTIIKPELISVTNEKLVLTVKNVSDFPIRVTGLNHKEKKQIIDLNPQIEISSGKTDTIIMDLPRSFENLFVSKKKKTTGFVLHRHIYDLKVSYKTFADDNARFAVIIPYQEKEAVAEDLFRSTKSKFSHPDLIINTETNILSFKKDSVVLNQPLILPSGYKFKPRPGTVIDIQDGGKIISYASFEMIANKNKPIRVISSDSKGQGILVLGAKETSKLRHVTFDGLTHPKHGDWSVTGAVTFYESPVRLSNVTVSNNRCEDALNIVRTTFNMVRCTIANTQSDAFDGDFVKGTISDSTFENLGNDAIDVSGSDITIKNVTVSYAGDKGLSAGEDSKMTVFNVEISNSEIGVAGKDLSIVDIKGITIKDTKLGFTAFKKKPEFGPSSITVINPDFINLEMKYLIESSSSLIVDGKKIETSQNVKDRMYGVEFGVSSAETRNSQ